MSVSIAVLYMTSDDGLRDCAMRVKLLIEWRCSYAENVFLDLCGLFISTGTLFVDNACGVKK